MQYFNRTEKNHRFTKRFSVCKDVVSKKSSLQLCLKKKKKAGANRKLSPAISQLSSHPEMETAYQDSLQSKQAYLGQL